jgi:hypothetical protein
MQCRAATHLVGVLATARGDARRKPRPRANLFMGDAPNGRRNVQRALYHLSLPVM